MTDKPERCQECGAKERLRLYNARFICFRCIVDLKLADGWHKRRKIETIRREKRNKLAKKWQARRRAAPGSMTSTSV